jgi:hypothetical protein
VRSALPTRRASRSFRYGLVQEAKLTDVASLLPVGQESGPSGA